MIEKRLTIEEFSEVLKGIITGKNRISYENDTLNLHFYEADVSYKSQESYLLTICPPWRIFDNNGLLQSPSTLESDYDDADCDFEKANNLAKKREIFYKWAKQSKSFRLKPITEITINPIGDLFILWESQNLLNSFVEGNDFSAILTDYKNRKSYKVFPYYVKEFSCLVDPETRTYVRQSWLAELEYIADYQLQREKWLVKNPDKVDCFFDTMNRYFVGLDLKHGYDECLRDEIFTQEEVAVVKVFHEKISTYKKKQPRMPNPLKVLNDSKWIEITQLAKRCVHELSSLKEFSDAT